MQKKSHIKLFIGHASEDKSTALDIYNRLKEAGYSPWIDKHDLIPGFSWEDQIQSAIKESTIFLACLSNLSVTKKGYLNKELRSALSILAELPAGHAFIIPIRLDECDVPSMRISNFDVNLRDPQWLNYWEANSFAKLEKAISMQCSKASISLPNISLSKLSDLLVAGSWIEADEATANIMLSITGKDSWMSVESLDIERFPRDILKSIDELWVKHSKGRFGFSVQAEVWHELGSVKDYETETKVADVIGWRRDARWIAFDDLIYNLTAPRGELPRFRCSRMGDITLIAGPKSVRLRWLTLLSHFISNT